MKAKYILAVFCGMLLCEALSAQTEEFRFKLYMESLSSGKKDTLELGVGPNGIVGCDYDSTLCTVYTEPFFDTVDHIGAFIVDDERGCRNWDIRYDWSNERGDTIRVNCPMYLKKRIGRLSNDMVIIFPLSELPIVFRWNQALLQDPMVYRPVFTNWCSGRRYCVGQGVNWKMLGTFMHIASSYELDNYDRPGKRGDSITFLTYIQDSSGQEHAYMHMFVCLGEIDRFSSNQIEKEESLVKIFPNPAKERFVWKSEIPIKHWQVFSQNGRIVIEGNDNQQEIDCQGWASGFYVFRWESR
ncbi:MAG: T9SS type A sorting domain-containing protein, partial [Bacteroidales bacterium]|nr:T9SS type A sorting domain-containing protein [Bacteroidales bacterium]